MTSRPLALALTIVAALASSSPARAVGAIGERAPDFALQDLAGKTRSLAQLKGKTVVLEWINPNCPFSDRQAREKTMTAVARKYGQVVWLGINSTNPTHRDYLEPAAHAAWAKKNGIDYAILYDPSGATGHAYGAKTTPHMFVVDGAGKILYNGAIDDDPSGRMERTARRNYVDGALASTLAGRAVEPATTQPYGCSVKY